MIRLLVAFGLFVLGASVTAAQDTAARIVGGFAPSAPQCVLHATTQATPTRVVLERLAAERVGAPTATFQVTYTGFSPQARAAFQYALDLWARLLTSPVTIKVEARYQALDEGVLGAASARFVWGIINSPAPGQTTFYPDALADALFGFDVAANQNNPGVDIIANFSNQINWYFGTDARPGFNQYDFVTVVLHELGHGLGFSGSASVSGSSGNWGLGANENIPVIFDRFVENASGTAMLAIPEGTQLRSFLTSGNVFFDGPQAGRPELYAPAAWDDGSSFSHFDEDVYPSGTPNALITPFVANGEAAHAPGPVMCRLFRDLGWTVNLAACDALSTDAEDDGLAPEAALTVRAYPNPFRSSATVELGALAVAQPVRVVAYDVLGRAVQTLYDGLLPPGVPLAVAFDGANLASGTYLVRVTSDHGHQTLRLVHSR